MQIFAYKIIYFAHKCTFEPENVKSWQKQYNLCAQNANISSKNTLLCPQNAKLWPKK